MKAADYARIEQIEEIKQGERSDSEKQNGAIRNFNNFYILNYHF